MNSDTDGGSVVETWVDGVGWADEAMLQDSEVKSIRCVRVQSDSGERVVGAVLNNACGDGASSLSIALENDEPP